VVHVSWSGHWSGHLLGLLKKKKERYDQWVTKKKERNTLLFNELPLLFLFLFLFFIILFIQFYPQIFFLFFDLILL
jgi:hypothetical protein